jgi:fatty-acyl-CoA synthase
VVDRIKDAINTGGVLVASREVEDAIYEHPAVAEVAVVGLAHERWIEAIAAVVVARDPVSPQELIAFARERLAAHKVPKSVHFVDELPKNASGKLLKRELRDQLTAPAAPSTS